MNFLCVLPVVASLFSACPDDPALAVGYVEGEYALIAPVETARVERVLVRRGETVTAGQPVAFLETRDAQLAVENAEATLAEAEAQLADLHKGKRTEEIAVLEAAVSSAEASRAEAAREFRRAENLSRRGIAADAELDAALTRLQTADAALERARAELAVARLPARAEVIEAAAMRRDQAEAALGQAQWRLEERVLRAAETSTVQDVLVSRGEVAGPQAPVISLLPEGAIRLKFYVAEEALSSIPLGSRLAVRCDGCPEGLAATVSYVAPEPEFTPPVIYSLETRQKLVHLIEARPEAGSAALKPGQIVDVVLREPTS